jgi:hypothetical protein
MDKIQCQDVCPSSYHTSRHLTTITDTEPNCQKNGAQSQLRSEVHPRSAFLSNIARPRCTATNLSMAQTSTPIPLRTTPQSSPGRRASTASRRRWNRLVHRRAHGEAQGGQAGGHRCAQQQWTQHGRGIGHGLRVSQDAHIL